MIQENGPIPDSQDFSTALLCNLCIRNIRFLITGSSGSECQVLVQEMWRLTYPLVQKRNNKAVENPHLLENQNHHLYATGRFSNFPHAFHCQHRLPEGKPAKKSQLPISATQKKHPKHCRFFTKEGHEFWLWSLGTYHFVSQKKGIYMYLLVLD